MQSFLEIGVGCGGINGTAHLARELNPARPGCVTSRGLCGGGPVGTLSQLVGGVRDSTEKLIAYGHKVVGRA